MPLHWSQSSHRAPILIRPCSVSASKRSAIIAVLTSVLIHGGMLIACVCLTPDAIRFVNVRHGAAATETQLVLIARSDNQPAAEIVLPPIWAGSSEIDRAVQETAIHRGIELLRRHSSFALTSLPDAPQADVAFSASDSIQHRKRAETLDDLKPRPMETQPRPRQSVQQLPPPISLPSVAESGTQTWMPEPLAANAPPKYPPDALRVRANGTVLLRITVSREGQVVGIEMKQSSGWPLLDQAASDAVSKWHFQKQGSKFAAKTQSVVVPIEFTMNRQP